MRVGLWFRHTFTLLVPASANLISYRYCHRWCNKILASYKSVVRELPKMADIELVLAPLRSSVQEQVIVAFRLTF